MTKVTLEKPVVEYFSSCRDAYAPFVDDGVPNAGTINRLHTEYIPTYYIWALHMHVLDCILRAATETPARRFGNYLVHSKELEKAARNRWEVVAEYGVRRG